MLNLPLLEELKALKKDIDGPYAVTRKDKLAYSAVLARVIQNLSNAPPLRFVVSIPYWGPWHSHTCRNVTIPSVLAAINYAHAEDRVRFVIHTISPDATKGLLKGFEAEYLPLPPHANQWVQFSMGHKDTLARAKAGECPCLLCADNLVSREFFTFTEWAVATGYKTIAALGPRVTADPTKVPIGSEASQLASWATEHPHPWTKSLFYNTGNSNCPSVVYFQGTQGISAHAFHLHPVMMLKDRNLTFEGDAIDYDLLNSFKSDEIYVVANNEIFLCDVTQPDRVHGTASPLNDTEIIQWAKNPHSVTPLHRWNFKHRITLTGQGANSQLIANHILKNLEENDGTRPGST
jgi:hypothetical protein